MCIAHNKCVLFANSKCVLLLLLLQSKCALLTTCVYLLAHHHPPTLTVEGEGEVALNDWISLFKVEHTAGLDSAIVVPTHSVNGHF